MPYVIVADTPDGPLYYSGQSTPVPDVRFAIRYGTFEEAIYAHTQLAESGTFLRRTTDQEFRVRRVDAERG